MINTLQEIQERFDKIKDHKPKASKKLSELGDILASAYKISPDLANEMWQYIINLNIADDISNAKFYIAQVFSKITDNLSPEDATSFVSMNPERIRLMILYGYDGVKLWDCLETLVRGYIQINAIDDANVCVEYFYEKFDGINSDRTEVYRIARKAASICVEYIQNGDFSEEAEELIDLLSSSENQDVNSIVEITKIVGTSEVCEDYDMLFFVTTKCQESVEFFDLLWEARKQFTLDELREKLLDFIESNGEKRNLPSNYIHEDEVNPPVAYADSKLCFYNDLIKNEDSLLEHYFSNASNNMVRNIICVWIFDNNWDNFSKYVSQLILSNEESNFNMFLKNELRQYMDACFYGAGRDSYDTFHRSYKELMSSRSQAFAEALVRISAITVGCPCHNDYLIFIKQFIQKLHGNLEVFNKYGFDEKVDKRTPFSKLKDYAKRFNASGMLDHNQRSAEYSLIMENFQFSMVLVDDVKPTIEKAYKLANDDDIAKFLFLYSHEWMLRRDIISACIRKNDIDRAIELIDFMISTKDFPGYNDRNGRGRSNMLTMLYLIYQYAYINKKVSGFNNSPHCLGYEAMGITDDMRQSAKQLVERIMPSLPAKAQNELIANLYKLDPPKTEESKNSFDAYIEYLMDEVDAYTTYLKTKKRVKAFDVNKVNWDIGECFKKLSDAGRVDIITKIMLKLASVSKSLLGVAYHFHILDLVSGISASDFSTVFNYNSEIFVEWLSDSNLTEAQIINVVSVVGKRCSRSDFMSFYNMILVNRGYIDGLENCFQVTAENTKQQLLFDGETAKIVLDYVESNDMKSAPNEPVAVSLHLSTTKKSDALKSIRVLSCKVNDIDLEDNAFIWYFEDNGPKFGFYVKEGFVQEELTIYSNCFEQYNIYHAKKIELLLVCMGARKKVIESMTPIIIEYDIDSKQYLVANIARRKEM